MVTKQDSNNGLDPQELSGLQEDTTHLDALAGMLTEGMVPGEQEDQKEPAGMVTSLSDTSAAAGDDKPPPDQAPDELTRLQTENSRLTKEAAARQTETNEQRIRQAAAAYADHLSQQYIQQGFDEQTAKQLALSETRAQVAEYIAKQSNLRATALELSQDYKIPREELDNFQDEKAMRQFAQMYSQKAGPQVRRIEALEKQVAELTKARVPAQKYDQGSRTKAGSSYADRLKGDGPLPSSNEIDQMTSKYVR